MSGAHTHLLVKNIVNTLHRNRGPTSALEQKDSPRRRNALLHRIVRYASFDETKSYIVWLEKHNAALLAETLADANVLSKLSLRAAAIHFSEVESAELIGSAHLSQRAYKALKKRLKRKKICWHLTKKLSDLFIV